MDSCNQDEIDVKNMIEGSFVQYCSNIQVGQYDTNLFSTKADTNLLGFTTLEFSENKDQKVQEAYHFEDCLVGENDVSAPDETVLNDNNFSDEKIQDIQYSKNAKKNGHTYQNMGTQYFNFINKALSVEEIKYFGILKIDYEKILEQAKKLCFFKSKTELINIHKTINPDTKIDNDLSYVDLITEKLSKSEPDLKQRILKYNCFVHINLKLFQEFKQEALRHLEKLEKEIQVQENPKTLKKLQIYEQIKIAISKIEEKIYNS